MKSRSNTTLATSGKDMYICEAKFLGKSPSMELAFSFSELKKSYYKLFSIWRVAFMRSALVKGYQKWKLGNGNTNERTKGIQAKEDNPSFPLSMHVAYS